MTSLTVPFHRPDLGDEEIEAVQAVLRSGWLTSGPKVAEFEANCAAELGWENVIAVSSCTEAMELALLTENIGAGDEVITTPLTFVATVASILRVGAKPVLVDIDPKTGLIDVDGITRAVNSKTRALMPVHLGGYAAPMAEILALAADNEAVVLDDAAHAWGSETAEGKVGSLGCYSAFSFYANKNVTTGEGGLLSLPDAETKKRAQMLRLHGIDRDAWQREDGQGFRFYDVAEIGLKANMSDMAAAVGIVQLRKWRDMARRRESIRQRYDEAFDDLTTINIPPRPKQGVHAWHVYAIEFTDYDDTTRDAFVDTLHAQGIGTSAHFKPLHLLTGPSRILDLKAGDFPHAENYYRSHVSLPIFPGMTDAEIEHVIAAVRGWRP